MSEVWCFISCLIVAPQKNCNGEDLHIIIIIIIILGISFMQGIYTYIPETNRIPREHCVATILM